MGSAKKSSKLFWIIPMGCFAMVLLSCGGCILIPIFTVYSAISGNEAFQQSLRKVQNDERVVAELGTPIKNGWSIQGNFSSTNGKSSADFAYPVTGPKGGGNVKVEAYSDGGEWTFEKLQVKTNSGKKIDLLSEEGIVVEPERVKANLKNQSEESGEGEATEGETTAGETTEGEATNGEQSSATGEAAAAAEESKPEEAKGEETKGEEAKAGETKAEEPAETN